MQIKMSRIFFYGIILVSVLFYVPSAAFGMGSKKVFSKPLNVEVTERTGSLKIVWPDGQLFNVDLEEKIPWIPSGSEISVIWGRAQLRMQYVDIVIKKGGILNLWGSKKTGTIHIMVAKNSKTNIKVTIGDTILILGRNDKVKIGIDELTKMAKITAIRGKIQVVRGEKRSIINQGMSIVSLLDVEERFAEIYRPQPEVIEESEASPFSP